MSNISNAPDRFLTWRWEEEPDDSAEFSETFQQQMTIGNVGTTAPPRRVTYTKDSKRPNAGTFVFGKEDHTLGNLLRIQLLRDAAVRYAGYRMPHPLVFDCHVRIETNSSQIPPVKVLDSALQDLLLELIILEKQFNVSFIIIII
jgi:DNA-directed RNA polymerase II subunit RPB11